MPGLQASISQVQMPSSSPSTATTVEFSSNSIEPASHRLQSIQKHTSSYEFTGFYSTRKPYLSIENVLDENLTKSIQKSAAPKILFPLKLPPQYCIVTFIELAFLTFIPENNYPCLPLNTLSYSMIIRTILGATNQI